MVPDVAKGRWTFALAVVVLAGLIAGPVIWYVAVAGQQARRGLSSAMSDEDRLIDTLTNRKAERAARARAASKLGDRGVVRAIPLLLDEVPGDRDVVTYDCLNALGKIGDRRALRVLKRIDADRQIDLPGKIRAALSDAIKDIERRTGAATGSLPPGLRTAAPAGSP